MKLNICLNCGYFLNCKYASKEITECDKYIKVHRTVTRIDNVERKD